MSIFLHQAAAGRCALPCCVLRGVTRVSPLHREPSQEQSMVTDTDVQEAILGVWVLFLCLMCVLGTGMLSFETQAVVILHHGCEEGRTTNASKSFWSGEAASVTTSLGGEYTGVRREGSAVCKRSADVTGSRRVLQKPSSRIGRANRAAGGFRC